MSDARDSEQGGREAELPERRVTVNMLIGYNMTYFRRAADLTQEQLGERLGWSNVAVSAAERSWDGKRVRKFDADEIASIAQAIDVPITALFLPPEDDLQDCRYVIGKPGHGEGSPADMRTLLSYALSDPPADQSPSGTAYERRYVAVVRKYFDSRVAEAVSTRLKQRVLEEELAGRMRRARVNYQVLKDFERSLAGVMADNGLLQHFLEAMLAETPVGRQLLGDIAEEEEANERRGETDQGQRGEQ